MSICPQWPSQLFRNAAYVTSAENASKRATRLYLRSIIVIAPTLLCGCVEKYEGTAYATVPIRTFATPHGVFEVLDRRDIERLAIRRLSDCQDRTASGDRQAPLKVGVLSAGCSSTWAGAVKFAEGLAPKIGGERREIEWTGSTFVLPIESYFANSNRDCKVLRGHPLVGGQWEFVYNCQPGSDPTKVVWGTNGYSQLWPR